MLTLITVVLLILNLTGVTSLAWIWVFLPLVLEWSLGLLVIGFQLFFASAVLSGRDKRMRIRG